MTARVRVLFVLLIVVVASAFSARADVINACVSKNGTIRILFAGDTCKNPDTPLSFNSTGPEGPAGKPGADGRPGLPGATGAPGTPGKDGKDGAAGKDGKNGADGSAGACTTPAPVVIGSISFTPTGSNQVPGAAIPIYDIDGSFENATTIGSATGGAGAGKVKFNEFRIKKKFDAASPALFLKLASGGHFSKATILLHRQGAADATLLVGTVFFTKISHEATSDAFENVTMVFGTASLTVDGATSCWDQIGNVSDCP